MKKFNYKEWFLTNKHSLTEAAKPDFFMQIMMETKKNQ